MVFGRLFRGGEASHTELQGQSRDESLDGKIHEACAVRKPGAEAHCSNEEAAALSEGGSTSDIEGLKEDGEDWDDWDLVEPPADGSTVEVSDGWIMSSKEDTKTVAEAKQSTGEDEDVSISRLSGPSESCSTAGQVACSDASACESIDDEPSFSCIMCRSPIFKADDIISSNYHAQTSPGYLISQARNTTISPELQTATYTTGQYTIQEVMCQRCSATLGVTYSGAAEPRNHYKVGKILVGRDRLQLPPGVVHPMDKAKH